MKMAVASVLIIVLACLCSCSGKPIYPDLLVQADSAYVQGHYALADSLLHIYDMHSEDNDDAIRNYHQLLKMEQNFVLGNLNENQFSSIDFLARYYSDVNLPEKYSKVLLFMSAVYRSSGDYPAALDVLLKAKQVAHSINNTRLLCLISRSQGDLYFEQQLFEECIPYYRDYYYYAKENRDTLRIALASLCMGKVSTINDEVDSTLYYYKKALQLSRAKSSFNEIESDAKNRLADIYIQTCEFDSALIYMQHNEENDYNWAFWHYGQNHLDSAAFYLNKSLGRFRWAGEVELLRMLAQLEMQRGNSLVALNYYQQYISADDSLKNQHKIEQTLKTNAQFNYNSIKQDRDKMETKGQRMRHLLFTILVAVLLLSVASFFAWKSYRQKKNAELVRERRLKIEVEKHYRQSMEQLEKNQMRMVELEQQLEAALREGNDEKAEELRADTQILTAENQEIRAIQQKKKLQEDNFKRQPLYSMVMNNVGTNAKLLTPDDWQRLAVLIDATYSDFTSRLISLSKLKDTELHVCYLLKMGVSPVDIGPMVGRVKSTVSMMSSRLYKKFTQGRGSTKELADFLLKF